MNKIVLAEKRWQGKNWQKGGITKWWRIRYEFEKWNHTANEQNWKLGEKGNTGNKEDWGYWNHTIEFENVITQNSYIEYRNLEFKLRKISTWIEKTNQ